MPEALAIFAVFAVIAASFIGARQHAGHGATDPRREIERLQHQERWLRQRLERAKRENWGSEMIAGFAKDLESTSRELAEAAGTAENS